MIRDQFHAFAEAKVAPFAHGWHLRDQLIPLELVEELGALGVFGLTIPEEHGGSGMGKTAMCVVSEELSRGWIGVGSLATRSEIAAELILTGGTEDQKARWLPRHRQRRDPADGRLHRAGHRQRPGLAAHPRDARTARPTGDRRQDLDHPRRPRRPDDPAGPHRPRDHGPSGLSMLLAPKPRGIVADPSRPRA
jgi:(2S)-methylsuccinyl-CoA dehydrogenase